MSFTVCLLFVALIFSCVGCCSLFAGRGLLIGGVVDCCCLIIVGALSSVFACVFVVCCSGFRRELFVVCCLLIVVCGVLFAFVFVCLCIS